MRCSLQYPAEPSYSVETDADSVDFFNESWNRMQEIHCTHTEIVFILKVQSHSLTMVCGIMEEICEVNHSSIK